MQQDHRETQDGSLGCKTNVENHHCFETAFRRSTVPSWVLEYEPVSLSKIRHLLSYALYIALGTSYYEKYLMTG